MNEFEPIEKASHQHPLLYWKGYICVWMLMIPVQPDSLTLINSIPELSMTVEEWMCFLFPFIFVFERRYLIFCSDIVPSFQISALFSSIGLTFYIFQTNRFDAQTNGTIRWQLLLISDSVACIHRTQRYRDNTQYSLLTKYDFQKKKWFHVSMSTSDGYIFFFRSSTSIQCQILSTSLYFITWYSFILINAHFHLSTFFESAMVLWQLFVYFIYVWFYF